MNTFLTDFFKKSALNTVTSVVLNLTNNSYTQDDLTLAIYNEAISGWGFIPSPKVDFEVNLY